jgi:hypothetical protein
MPATFIILPAIVIGVTAWLAAWWYTRNPAEDGVRDEIHRVRNHAAWLEHRLDTARQERWDRDMIVSLSDQLGAACNELARAQRGSPRRPVATPR